MAFLDRLVSDLIRKSTGFNARPFVRRVGAKNILLLGGAAVAGAIAAEKARQSSGSTGAAAGGPPPPPPLPTETPPLPPPVPQAAPEPEIPQDLLFAIVRTMVAGALADGQMHSQEKRIIEDRLGESGLSPDRIQRIHKDMVIPPPPVELAGMVTSPDDRELLYRFGALVVMADSELSDTEKSWLEKLAAALGIDEARRERLEKEIFQVT